MNTESNQNHQGTFQSPDPNLRDAERSGKLVIKGTDDAKWLWLDYKKGDNSLTVKADNENIRMVAGSKISFKVRKPSDGVTLEYRGEVEGEWVWTDPSAGIAEDFEASAIIG